MLAKLPENALQFMDWSWSQMEPYYNSLSERELHKSNVHEWLGDWTRLSELVNETYHRLYIDTTLDTRDETAENRYQSHLDNIYPKVKEHEQKLKNILLDSGIVPEGFEVPLQRMRAEADIYREENLPLKVEELNLSNEYNKIIGAQTVIWNGKEITLDRLNAVMRDPDRRTRERAWRLLGERRLADRESINNLWVKFMAVRHKLAENTGLKDFRDYQWLRLKRFDYTPDDCIEFDEAIEQVIVPVADRLLAKRCQLLDIKIHRPWDMYVDPYLSYPLKPFKGTEELKRKTNKVFTQVDPQFGKYFETMSRNELLDIDNRKGKAPGGYCIDYPVMRKPFIFINAVGTHEDVETLLHEGGHAFHYFESAHLPYLQQLDVGLEFAEVASMGMEFLSAPFLSSENGGYYDKGDTTRARIEQIFRSLYFWPYMAVVDLFQHWVYTHHEAASDPANCDNKWLELWDTFRPSENWDGFDQEKMTGWHNKLHIHLDPFYYIEYGLAQLGAFQIWQNATHDQAKAVKVYRQALSLGGTARLPQLFAAAGATFAFDADTLINAVSFAVSVIEELEEELE